jgi:hypothetical protein|uniref:PDZ domain-containing protein n=1 Tax=Haptolina ericina TaxID=156174 RepID=A0A7S3AGE8_9EUKA|mmetsp:Transcript_1606/g.3511  ORF Transcript_1606/g.3511 Transcript_1606/m.3511 type:complete len:227 (+) Transcript_1606:31-711(+)|eukprot:CAMPEP_0181197080 /NCGR_PEP_ID=MMETSP1096-20121128/15835_1 /TAXON_ID=156174 ORGANISM="Chrysochromulina ericina, Strain CCMP281" /NCGR_SAMPLE_ID=MMETSP1096 /ASSEMBLY_ACC=CAM_ASM_000453 /LENGTH=226 /DNA_ID=CAMNT_0023286937 /DNA_START=22 /DNA_END=702 /DNA_ORIENTATION=+
MVLLRPAPHVLSVFVQKKQLMGVRWRHDVKPAVVDHTFSGFPVSEILFHGDRIDAVNGIPTKSPSEVVSAWRAAQHQQVELTIQREETLRIIINKPAPTGEVVITWQSGKSPMVAAVQLSGGAAYLGDAARPDSLKSDQTGVSFEYSPTMLWPSDLVVALNGVAAGDPTVLSDMLSRASGQLVLSIQRDVKPPLVADTTCGCLDWCYRTKPATRDGVVATTGTQNI